MKVLDLRAEQPLIPPLYGGKNKHRRVFGRGPKETRPVVQRDPQGVDGIVIHQTACVYGPNAHRRALRVACHALAFMDGAVVLANPFRSWVNHGNGLNDRSLGYEIEGRFAGVEGNPRTAWKRIADPVTDEVIHVAREGLRVLVETAWVEGYPIEWIWAHRQSSADRRSDPGSGIWGPVVMDFAVPVLGLRVEPARTWGDGRPIPTSWDPSQPAVY